MVNAGSGAGELGLRYVLAVIDHERNVDVAVGHVPRRVAARISGLGLVDAKDILVEFGRRFEVFDLERDMNDAGHETSLSTPAAGGESRVELQEPKAELSD